MTDPNSRPDRPPARRTHDVPGETITVRQRATDSDTFAVRMPVATTGEVRNDGDEPLTRAELRGMAKQINSRAVPVFPDHGSSGLGGREPYSAVEKLGEWREAEVREHSNGHDFELVATAELMNPETMPAAAGRTREVLSVLKEQVERGMSLSSSIGWRDDGSYPGGVDLMEASIVGVGADPRTASDAPTEVLARAAVDAGADPEDFIQRVREAVAADDRDSPTADGERPLGPPGDRDRFEDFDECVATLTEDDDTSQEDAETICGAWEQASKDDRARKTVTVGETDIDVTPPEAVQNAAEVALDAKQEMEDLADCGTGEGEETARLLVNDDMDADRVEDMAQYLTSHAEDVEGTDDPPTDWGTDEWLDGCGHVQYALWGGTATGTGIEWAQSKANQVADARDEDLPYPERRLARNLDDPAFAEGDAVMWTWQGEPVHGRVADIGAEFTVAGNTITGDEGEAIYLIHDYDEDREAYDREGTAKPESSLSESQMDLPPATEDNFMSTDTTDPGDDQQAGTDDADSTDPDGQRAPGDIDEADVAEFVSEVYDGVDGADVQDAMAEAGAEFTGLSEDTVGWFFADVLDVTAGEVMDMMDADGEQATDEDDGEDDDMEDMGAEGSGGQQDADDGDLAERVAELEATLADVRSGEADLDTGTDDDTETRDADTDAEQSADTDDAEDRGDNDGPAWRA